MNEAEVVFQAVKDIMEHMHIKLEQTGNNMLTAKLLIKTDSGVESVFSEDSISFEPRPTLFC